MDVTYPALLTRDPGAIMRNSAIHGNALHQRAIFKVADGRTLWRSIKGKGL